MIPRGLTEQFPPGDPVDPAADDPVLRNTDPVADPAPVEAEPATVEGWRAVVASLQARIAEIETPPDRLLLLKVAASIEHVAYETLRRWFVAGKVEGEKRDGHVFISLRSLQAYLKPLRDRGV
jgi:hypothetical protein